MTRVALTKLHPAPWNPRTLRDARFQNLCRSIEADPGLLELRPILATKNGTIYGGNQRYRAVQHLGWEDVPAELSDIPEQLAKERALRDNGAWGEWVEDDLGHLLAELKDAGSDIDLLGFDSVERLLGTVITDPLAEWQGMPGFEQSDRLGNSDHQLVVHFRHLADKRHFGEVINQALTDKTKYVWFPEEPPADRQSQSWADEP
jgi:ParB-like nuclease domain